MKPQWYLLANGSLARLVEPEPENRRLRELFRLESARSRAPGHALTRDRPGLYRKGGACPGALGPSEDPRRREAETFAREVAARLVRELAEGGCERLVLVAPARLCESIHQRLPVAQRERVVRVLHKDYMHLADRDLYRMLREATVPAA